MSKRRVVIFGTYEAAHGYAQGQRLSPAEWFHASAVERVKGLDPTQFETVLVGEHWDKDTIEAKREWDFMMRRFLSKVSQ